MHQIVLMILSTVVNVEIRIVEIFMLAADADGPTIWKFGTRSTKTVETPYWMAVEVGHQKTTLIFWRILVLEKILGLRRVLVSGKILISGIVVKIPSGIKVVVRFLGFLENFFGLPCRHILVDHGFPERLFYEAWISSPVRVGILISFKLVITNAKAILRCCIIITIE